MTDRRRYRLFRHPTAIIRPPFLLLAAALLASSAVAGMPAGLVPGERVAVAAALDGDTLRLVDGRELKLLGIEAPHASPEAQRDPDLDRLAEAARAALAGLAQGGMATLYAEAREEGAGRIAAQVEIARRWVQGDLLARGFARVHTAPGRAAGAAQMLRLEAAARQAQRGIWTHPAFRLRKIGQLDRWIDSFQIVEGRLAAVGSDEGSTVLSFTEEASEMLTVVVPAEAQQSFRAARIDFDQLVGWQGLRLRGWIRWRDGPFMELEDPAQLEVPDG